MSIGLTDELEVKTKKGKLAAAKQVFLDGDQENLQQIGDKTHQLENAVKDITATGGASTANAVSYNNKTSGMTAVTAQGAIDELMTKNKSQDAIIAAKAEKSDVQASVSELKEKDSALSAELAKKANAADVTSKIAEESNRVNSELAKKANAEDISSQMQTEQERVNAEFVKKFDKESILQDSGDAEDKVMSQKAVKNITDILQTNVDKKANKIVRFDNAQKQYETDNRDVETANSHILEFYTDLVLLENERLVITNITCLKPNYYINISKFNSSTNVSEYIVTPQSQLIDNGVTILKTIDGEYNIFILFVSNGDKTIDIHNIGQGEARMPYATEHAFSFNENKTILSFLNNINDFSHIEGKLDNKVDKSNISQELGTSTELVVSQKAVKNITDILQTNVDKKANKIVRFDNAQKQYETDNRDVETANSHILEFYTDLVLLENERLVITNITCLKPNYYINISKFNSSTNVSEYIVTPQSQLIDNGVTILKTIDGEYNIFILFVSNGDKTIDIHNIGQGEARMPYATEHAFSFNENKTILSFLNNINDFSHIEGKLDNKVDKSNISQELGTSTELVVSQNAVKNVADALQDSINTKVDKIVRFDNLNQEQSDIVDTEEANRDFLEIYTNVQLSENERIVLVYLSHQNEDNYVIFGKFNSSTNEESSLTEQVTIESGKVTEINTTDGKKIYVLFDISKYKNEIRNVGQGYKRMPYLNEKAYSLIYNDNIRNYINSSSAKESQKVITIWGDSITWGSNASKPSKCYAMILQSLLTNNDIDAKVINCGVGGENFQNILVRQGAFGFYLSEDITIPHDKSNVTVETNTNYILDGKFKNTWYGNESYFGLLLQGENGRGSEAEEYKTVNPIYANGHKYKMSYNGDLQNATISLCLDEDVTNDVVIKKGTPLYCHGNSFKSDISVFSIGTNDGWTIKNNDVFDAEKSAENYINMIDLAIEKAGTSKVIICSPYGGSALNTAGVEGLKVLESALAKHFGSRFFNWREYLVNYGLADAGLSATEQDLKDINAGKCPSSLLSDVVHPNDKGHEVIGKKLYEIMKLNGFV